MKLAFLCPAVALGALLVPSVAAPSSSGLSFVKPGGTASVKLELSAQNNVLFNRLGPSKVVLNHAFGKALELELKTGTPHPADPENYFERVPVLEFKLPVPKTAKPGNQTLSLEATLFLCDASIKVCYREVLENTVELRVGASGQDRAAVLVLNAPK